ncbi:aminodeoxychorismate lyase [Corynebacterium sp. H128]|uniref:aminodeoxychorismate lyase n=1 Tax=unclassified Corynebacterium TaxID=2624378 RepID=UPI0030B1A273
MSTHAVAPLIYILEPFGGSTREHSLALPMIFWDDAAVTRGDGVFESIRIIDGKAKNLHKHAERFARSAAILGLPVPDSQHWIHATEEAAAQWAEKNGPLEGACTWTMSRGRASRPDLPTTWLVVKPLSDEIYRQRKEGVKVLTGPRGYQLTESAPWSVAGAKTLGYVENMAALRYARQQGFDDVIFRDGDRVLEGATSTIISVRGTKLRTPTPGGEILAGTTQAGIFEYAVKKGWTAKTKDLEVSDLLKSESVWLVSSTRGAVLVTQLDEHKLKPAGDLEAARRMLQRALEKC